MCIKYLQNMLCSSVVKGSKRVLSPLAEQLLADIVRKQCTATEKSIADIPPPQE